MYTFFDQPLWQVHTPELLRTWEMAWQRAGWETRVLTMKDAEQSDLLPVMEKLLEGSDLSQFQRMEFYRWVAMANAVPEEGGW